MKIAKEKDKGTMRKNNKNTLCKFCKKRKVRKVGYFKTKEPMYGCICELCKIKKYVQFKKDICENCGFVPLDSCQLDVDHIDNNHYNNDIENLRTLCANCHRLKTKLERDKKRDV